MGRGWGTDEDEKVCPFHHWMQEEKMSDWVSGECEECVFGVRVGVEVGVGVWVGVGMCGILKTVSRYRYEGWRMEGGGGI